MEIDNKNKDGCKTNTTNISHCIINKFFHFCCIFLIQIKKGEFYSLNVFNDNGYIT